MTTAPKTFPTAGKTPLTDPVSKAKTRRDRITGLIMIVVLAILMCLMIWLASLGSGSSGSLNDYWPMMP